MFFRVRCIEMGIHLVFAPVESHSSLGLVERMHGPIRHRHIHHNLMMERTLGGPRPKALCLAAATRALNDTAGQNGLVPTLLVFGALPNVILDMKQMSSFPSQKDRISLLSIARDAEETHIAAARLSEAEKHSIPSGDYLLSPGDQVLVFREQHGWQGPATFLDRGGGIVSVLVKGRRITFPSTRIKPAILYSGENLPSSGKDSLHNEHSTENEDCNLKEEENDDNAYRNSAAQDVDDVPVQGAVDLDITENNDVEDMLHDATVYMNEVVKNPNDERFVDAIAKRVDCLMERGVFDVVEEGTVHPGSNLMGSKLHLVVKNCETSAPVFKAKLVILGHTDAEKEHILSEAPTVGQMSIRILVSLSVPHGWPLRSRDVRQAFLQSESPLSRVVYMRPPRQLRDKFAGKVLRVEKPL
jgi:hypothetical protein